MVRRENMQEKVLNGNPEDNGKETIPLYHQIVSDLKDQINRREMNNGDKLPTEKWLSEHYKVSRVTVRKALEDLIEQGYLEKRPNRGCFVIQPKFEKDLSRMRSLHRELLASGIIPSSKIISYQEVAADPWIGRHLQCEEGDIVLVIKRIRYADDRPFAEQTIYLPKVLFNEFNPWLLRDHSLHDLIEEEYSVPIISSTQTITARMPSKEQVAELDLKAGKPILHIRGTVFTEDDKVCEYSDTYFITDVVRYSFSWSRR